MAMLAEPRRKQRIGPNPRGKFFTDDQDNIGRQMLKKMGWKSGDGLGATSQGMSEPIKPKIHTDARGLGYDKTQDPWVAHNEEFEQLLKNLNASTSDDNAGVKSKPSSDLSEEDSMSGGLETKSKTSRARIHYHKFVKNKDLSRASTKDISCIFGKAVSEIDNSLLGNPDKNSDVCLDTNNTAFKWEFKNSFETNEGSAEIGENEAAEESSNEKRKKKKKKRNKEKENEVIEEEEGLVETQQEEIVPNEEECEVKTKKKKKKKHRNEDNQSALLEEDNATQTNQIEDDINSSEQDSVKKRKKSKKRKHSNDEDQSNISEVKIEVAILNGEPVVENTENELESIEENNLQTNQFENDLPSSNSSDQDSVKKRKKSKKRKRENDEEHQADNIEQVEAVEPICEAVDEEQRSKKKKKRKKSKDDTAKDELLTTEDTTEVGKEASADAEPKPNNQEPPNNDNVESFGSLQFINRGSIEDYFRNKRLEMLNRLKAKGNTSV